MITRSHDQHKLLFISHIRLAETVWVLERTYKFTKIEMCEILHKLLQTQELIIEKHDILWKGPQDYNGCKSLGFVDCLIGRQDSSNDCAFTYTFGKQTAKEQKTFHKL